MKTGVQYTIPNVKTIRMHIILHIIYIGHARLLDWYVPITHKRRRELCTTYIPNYRTRNIRTARTIRDRLTNTNAVGRRRNDGAFEQ